MRKPFKTLSWWVSFVLLVATAFTAEAQVTTASFTGKVTDPQGNPVPGATIIATHVPSGTVNGTTSNVSGNYNLLYLRTGGPYTLKVTFVGYKTIERPNLYLSLSEQKNIDFALAEENATVDVEITAEKNATIAADRTGAKQNVSTTEIENLPTIARSITDFTKLSPQVVGNSAGGTNFRYNNIQIDGAAANDAFGLADSGTSGGLAGAEPIGLDAIAEFNIEIAPYDVRQSGFTGGLINAITRSGSNTYQGSAFFYGRNQDFTGRLTKDAGGNVIKDGAGNPTPSYVSDFANTQTGIRIGGPIIKNKLFFFVNGELRRRGDPTDAGLKDYNTTATNIFNANKADMDRIVSIAKSKYGLDAGSYDTFNSNTNSDYLLTRLDYNINNNHRLMLRHNYVNAGRAAGVVRATTSFSFDSQAYDFANTQNSTVLQLTSVFGAKIGNEARLVYTTIRDERRPQNSPMAMLEIQNVTNSGSRVLLGIDRSSQQNALDQNLFSFTDNFSYFAGNHSITAGVQVDHSSFSNLFVQDAYGSWTFTGINEFESGTPNRYRKSYLLPGGKERAAWAMLMSGVYLQDQWKALPNLRLTFGVRADLPSFLDKPTANPQFATDFPGRSTDEVPSGQILFSPRFGFNWDVFRNKKTQLRGGVGVFTGKTPGVWLSNQYSNTGKDYARIDIRSGLPAFNPDPNFIPSTSVVVPTTDIALTDKSFRLPQNLRSNIGLDQELPWGLVGTLEFLYTQTLYDIFYENINLDTSENNLSKTVVPTDGRPYYIANRIFPTRYNSVILLRNATEGHQSSATVQVRRPERNGFFFSLAYTRMKSLDVNSGRSAVAISQWNGNEMGGNPNLPVLKRSDYEVPNRVVGTVSYKFNWGPKNIASTISLLYEGRNGTPYNFVYNGDANNDGNTFNDLVYVPAAQSEVVFLSNTVNGVVLTPDEQWAKLDAFMKSIPALDANRGKIFPRNGAYQPWRNNLDLRFTQDLPSIKNQRFQLTLDVLNILSMINEDWGIQKFVNFEAYNLLSISGYEGGTGKPRVRFTPPVNGTPYEVSQVASRWQMQLGLRYTF